MKKFGLLGMMGALVLATSCAPTTTEKKEEIKPVPDYRLVGEVFNTYVIVELGEIM